MSVVDYSSQNPGVGCSQSVSSPTRISMMRKTRSSATKRWKVSVILCIHASRSKVTLTAATTVGNAIRTSWTFGPPERPDAATGNDFVVLDENEISSLYAFVERPDE